MKASYPLLFIALTPLCTAEPVPPDTVVEEVVVEEVEEGRVVEEVRPANDSATAAALDEARRIDTEFALRHLGTLPRSIPDPRVTEAPRVETEITETVVEEPGQPTRVYYTERNVVVVEGRELPYVTIPVLFEKETANLLEHESRLALEDIASAIREVLASDPDAVFDVEGHTSVEGTEEFNMELSAKRARRVYEELTETYNIPASALSAHGYGENYAQFPEGTEQDWVFDRRVLVVRVK